MLDVDGYDGILGGTIVNGDEFKQWLRTRTPGLYSPSQIDAVRDDEQITVCEVSSPGVVVPGQPTADGTGSSQLDEDDPTASLIWIGFEADGPTPDAIGPRPKIDELLRQLG